MLSFVGKIQSGRVAVGFAALNFRDLIADAALKIHHKEAYRDQKGEQTMQSDAGMPECISLGRFCHGVLFGDALEPFSTVPQCSGLLSGRLRCKRIH
jgi:hypothetical protein